MIQYIFFGKIFKISLLAILIIELLSWIVTGLDDINKIFFALVLGIVFILSLIKLEWGIYIVMAELIIGSKGYLLAWLLSGFSISLRLGLFLVVFLAWIIWAIREKQIKFFKTKFWKYYLIFLIAMVLALVIGYLKGNDLKNIFFDWNGYLYFGLLFPLTQAITSRKKIEQVWQVVFGGITAVIIKTLFLLFIFSQQNTFYLYLAGVYKWIRDTGVGEITAMDNGFYRIFFQSHIYAVILFFIGLSILSIGKYKEFNKKCFWKIFVITALSLLLIFLSYSRSFWVASVFVLFIFFIVLLFVLKQNLIRVLAIGGILIFVFAADYALALGIINFPLPGNLGVDIGSLISERTKDPTQEAAGSSRMELLKPLLEKNKNNALLGGGFGSTVTYKTQDPRALKTNPDGDYTTFAFEWGYLDLWLKFGLYGASIYLFLLWQILKTGYVKFRNESDIKNKSLLLGSLLGLVAICVIHFFTPYLNHPLGIGWILLCSQIYSLNY